MKKTLQNKLCEEVYSLREKLIKKISEGQLGVNEKKWLNGIVYVMGSKKYIESNVDDLAWFQDNGLLGSNKIMDFGTGGGYIAHLASHITGKVVAYEYNGDWVGKEFDGGEYENAFGFMQKIVNEIDDKKVAFNFYKSLPLNEDNGSYDGVILYAVVEHIDSDVEEKVFKELYRVLKPGGSLYIAKLPRRLSYQEFIARKLKMGSHINLFTRKKIKKLLKTYGFKTVRIEESGLFFNHPNKIINLLYPFLSVLEFVLKYTPLAFFSHDIRIVAQKK